MPSPILPQRKAEPQYAEVGYVRIGIKTTVKTCSDCGLASASSPVVSIDTSAIQSRTRGSVTKFVTRIEVRSP